MAFVFFEVFCCHSVPPDTFICFGFKLVYLNVLYFQIEHMQTQAVEMHHENLACGIAH